MRLYRFSTRGTGYAMVVNGKERLVDRVFVYDENGPIISSSPSSMSDTWPEQIEFPDFEVSLKRKIDFSKGIAFVVSETMSGFTPRFNLYLPAAAIGLSEPKYTKDEENMCFIEIRTTKVDGFVFRVFHSVKDTLTAIEVEISAIGGALQSNVWRWDPENPLSKYIDRLTQLRLEHEAELKRIHEMTAEDLIRMLQADK